MTGYAEDAFRLEALVGVFNSKFKALFHLSILLLDPDMNHSLSVRELDNCWKHKKRIRMNWMSELQSRHITTSNKMSSSVRASLQLLALPSPTYYK